MFTPIKEKKEYKIALIQPIVKIGKTLRIQKSPAGIQYIGAQLKKAGYKVKLFHEIINRAVIKTVLEFNPDQIGISTMTANFLAGKELASQIKKQNKKVIITLGGWHATGSANSYLNNYEDITIKEILYKKSPFDFIVVGEGELVYSELIEKLRNNKPISDIVGLGYIEQNKIILSRANRILDLDSLEDPIWDGLDINKYRDLRSGELDLSLHIQRGCRFNCAYCSTPNMYQGKQTRLSAKRAAKQIKYLVDNFSPNVITFTDEDFFGNLPWIDGLCNEIIKLKLNKKIKFDTFGSINDIIRASESGLLKKMKTAGFNSYFVGIESLNKKTLLNYNRPIKKERPIKEYLKTIQKAIDLSNDAGLIFLPDYMVGAFWESEKEVISGFNKLKKLKNIPYVYLPILTPMPGTKLWNFVFEKDLIITKNEKIDWNKYNASSQTVKLGYDVVNLRNKLEIEFYTSKQYLTEMNTKIKTEKNQKSYYLGLFNKLSKDHSKSAKIKNTLQKIKNM